MRALGLVPDPWQIDVLRSTADRVIVAASRQCGKSTVASLAALHTILYRPNSLVLMLAPVQRQSQELLGRTLAAYRKLGRPVPPAREMQTSLELVNGSRLICLPGDAATVRCFSEVTFALFDEAAMVADSGLFAAVLPMLAISKSKAWAISSPFGRRGWFWEQFASDDPTWEKWVVKSTQCPRIDPAFVEQQRRLLGDRYARQEFGVEFLDSIGQVFSTESVMNAFTPSLRPLPGF
jgi:hypothetical protein